MGTAGRFGSVVMDKELEPTKREYSDLWSIVMAVELVYPDVQAMH